MTLATLLDPHPADTVALIDGDQATTYGELRDLVAETRDGLIAHGLRAGDRVAVLATNTRATVVSILGTSSAGMAVVLLDPNAAPAELVDQVDCVGAQLLLTGTPPPAPLTLPAATPAGTEVEGIEPLPVGSASPVAVSDDDLAVLIFTSGTAGAPKAAMISHGNLTSNQHAVIDTPGSGLQPGAVVLAVVPISHMYGLNVALLTSLRAGATIVLQHGFDPTETLRLIREHGIDRFAASPRCGGRFSIFPTCPTTRSRA